MNIPIFVRLSDLLPGQSGQIISSDASPSLNNALQALGCLPGERVEFLGSAPFGDPVRVRVGNSIIGLRRTEARHLSVEIRP